MSAHLNFFRMFTAELESKIAFEGNPYQFSYEADGVRHSLTTGPMEGEEIQNSQIYITEEDSNWSMEKNNLQIERNCTINNPKFLFGENGLIGEDSILGIGLSWYSKTSNQRGVVSIAELCEIRSNQPFNFQVSCNFKAGQLKGVVTFDVIMYLKKNNHKGIPYFAQHEGTLLGILDSYTLVLDGSGSMFPILEVNDPNKPLWWVSCDWTDFSDPFSEEYVSVNLNTAHRFYKQINMENGLRNSPILIEIIASAIQIFIQRAKDSGEWDQILSNTQIETGSIAQAIKYFSNAFDWDFSNPENLAYSIRVYLEKNI